MVQYFANLKKQELCVKVRMKRQIKRSLRFAGAPSWFYKGGADPAIQESHIKSKECCALTVGASNSHRTIPIR